MKHKSFQYCIDTPSSDEIVSSPFVLISGWIIYKTEDKICNPKICYENKLVQPLKIINRPDVKIAYPTHSNIGFSNLLSLSELYIDDKWSIVFTLNNNEYSFPINFKFDSKIVENFIHDKQEKLKKIRSLIRCPVCENENISNIYHEQKPLLKCSECKSKFSLNDIQYNFLTPDLIVHSNVKSSENVSANKYDPVAVNIIEQFKDGLILDNGFGLRNVYYDNVVNLEIVDYPTTDVVGIGEKLPFKSEIFDAVFSLAVLEHVKNPFECSQEITRVLKPGGILYAAVPFLQPFHGYPDHYYNMTSSGLKNLFSGEFEIIKCSVPQSGLPIWCLTWFLNSYIRGLPEAAASEFKNMKIADLLDHPHKYLEQDFVAKLSAEANEELACVNCLIAKKL